MKYLWLALLMPMAAFAQPVTGVNINALTTAQPLSATDKFPVWQGANPNAPCPTFGRCTFSTTPAAIATYIGTVVNCTSAPLTNLTCSVPPSGDITGITDTAAIKAALNVGANLVLQNAVYFSTGSVTQDISKSALFGNGAEINFSPMLTSATAWTITATVGGVSADEQHVRYSIENVYFQGPNGGTGVVINSAAEPAAAFFSVNKVNIQNFDTCVQVGNNVYDVDFYATVLNGCNITGISIPSGLSDSFERIAFHGGAITNVVTAISNRNGNGELYLFGTSIDSATTYVYSDGGGRTFFYGVHSEIIHTVTTSLFQLEGGAGNSLTIDGGIIIDTGGTQPFAWPSVFDIASGSNVVLTGAVNLSNLKNNANVLMTGSGTLTIIGPVTTFGSGNNPPIVGNGEILGSADLSAANTWSGVQTYSANPVIKHAGSSGSSILKMQANNTTTQSYLDMYNSGGTEEFQVGVAPAATSYEYFIYDAAGNKTVFACIPNAGGCTFGASGTTINLAGTTNLSGVSNGGTASKYVCVDSSGNLVIQTGAC